MSKIKIQKQEEYRQMAESPEPHTWSAQMPAYCYTELCPVPGFRELPEKARDYILTR